MKSPTATAGKIWFPKLPLGANGIGSACHSASSRVTEHTMTPVQGGLGPEPLFMKCLLIQLSNNNTLKNRTPVILAEDAVTKLSTFIIDLFQKWLKTYSAYSASNVQAYTAKKYFLKSFLWSETRKSENCLDFPCLTLQEN